MTKHIQIEQVDIDDLPQDMVEALMDINSFPEWLLAMTRLMRYQCKHDGLIICIPTPQLDIDLARIKVAFDFYNRGSAFHFRAIAEGWDHDRVIQELY